MREKIFAAFITCGYPDIETTKQIIHALYNGGADIIELGIPFSDPTAEGPIIQAANYKALSNGITTDKILDMVKEIRSEINVKLLFVTYANVIYSYGTEKFMKAAADAGINGIILPDVPFEEKDEFKVPAKRNGLDYISQIAPASKARIEMIAEEAEGFIYCTASSDEMTDIIRNVSDIPVLTAAEISTPEQAHECILHSDGIIIDSEIIHIIGKYGSDCISYVQEYAGSIKNAL